MLSAVKQAIDKLNSLRPAQAVDFLPPCGFPTTLAQPCFSHMNANLCKQIFQGDEYQDLLRFATAAKQLTSSMCFISRRYTGSVIVAILDIRWTSILKSLASLRANWKELQDFCAIIREPENFAR